MQNNINQETIKERKLRVRRIIQTLKSIFPHPKIALRYSTNWELLVAVVLSAQCTDKKVNEVTEQLFKKYRTFDDYIHANLLEFQKDIKPTGFYRNKAKNILSAAHMIKEKFNGVLPKTMDEILLIPGIGRKSANVILGNAYGVVQGIAVDTHVRRLSKLLGLTVHIDPDKIERDLMDIVSKKEWFNLTYRLIDYGRKYCGARLHDHSECPLSKL